MRRHRTKKITRPITELHQQEFAAFVAMLSPGRAVLDSGRYEVAKHQ